MQYQRLLNEISPRHWLLFRIKEIKDKSQR